MSKVKTSELRALSKDELMTKLDEFKTELCNLRVVKETSYRNAKSGTGKISVFRKNIARVLTVYSEKCKEEVREQCATDNKPLPKKLRPKTTKAERLALTPEQKAMKSKKHLKLLRVQKTRKYTLV